MDALFLTLLNRGLAAAWLVLAVLLLRVLLRRAPKNLRILLWGFVAIRLLLPTTVKTPFSLIPSAQLLSPEAVTAAVPTIDSGLAAVDAAINPVMASSLAPAPVSSANPLQIWLAVGAVIWLIGFGAMLLYVLVSTLLLRRRMAEAVFLRDNIWLCDRAASPFVLGLLRPRIYLPFGLDEETMGLVLAHEQGHIARHDHWFKPFAFLLLALYWFHPLLWLAYGLFCRDLELACDEYVLKALGREARKPYARALVQCGSGGHLSACPVAFGETAIKGRVRQVLRYRPSSRRLLVLALPLCVLLAALFLTDPGLVLLHRPEAVESVAVFDGATGRALTVTDRETVGQIAALTHELELRRGSVSLGYTGYRFRITFEPSGESFLLNAPDTVRKDPFFYTTVDNGLYAYLESLYPPLEPDPAPYAPELPPVPVQPPMPGADARTLLLSFANAEVVTAYDRTGRAYFPPLLSFDELIDGSDWTLHSVLTEFPASAPDRLIELTAGGRVLRIEDDSSGDLLYMIYDADWDWGSPVIYLDGGDDLMDDWMSWALAEQSGA